MPQQAVVALLAITASALVLATGCATQVPYPGERSGGAIEVIVRNTSQDDVEVHVDRDGSRRRLGLVLRSNTGEFSLAGTNLPMSGRVRFALNELGTSERVLTQAVIVEGGETIIVSIGPDLELTQVDVRR